MTNFGRSLLLCVGVTLVSAAMADKVGLVVLAFGSAMLAIYVWTGEGK